MNTPRLFARPQREVRGWNSELALRYGAATLVTLIALAAAQLVLPTRFMLALGAVTLLGVPVALWMRLNDMRVGGIQIPRPLWNALTVTASVGASAFFLRVPLRNILGAMEGGMNDAAILNIGATEPMLLLVQLFLIFAAFRSFSLISDKDATLATVPSFSVLLLLIPVYPNVEVVCYFLLWTLVATMLFALDHRSEIHERVSATVPAPAPGQDVRLAARTLAGVLGVSLVAAVLLSGLLTARDPREGSSSDSAISLLAGRLTRFSLQTEVDSGGSGANQKIDFSSGTALPTRAKLWRVNSVMTAEGKFITPVYWRLFTLSNYNGAVWSQSRDDSQSVKRTRISRASWQQFIKSRRGLERANTGAPRLRPAPFPRSVAPRAPGASGAGQQFDIGAPGAPGIPGRDRLRRPPTGFALSKARPELQSGFGTPRQTVTYQMQSERTTLGFVPLLPSPEILIFGDSDAVQMRSDGGVDVSVITQGQSFIAASQVPALSEYGILGAGPPLAKVDRVASAQMPTLSADERALYLALPPTVPARVRQFAADATRAARADGSNYARARLLARATQSGAIYTLRPPSIPAGRDASDFFLFESRRGYCTYFAGALTVLCRAQNIPARVVSGFVSPDSEGAGRSTIRDANAHAWTEIWVENWGWAVVDATPPDDRGDNAPTLIENWSDLASAGLDNFLRWSVARWPLLVGVGAPLLLALGFWRFRGGIARRLGRAIAPDPQARRREIAAEYERAMRPLLRRFRARETWETPDEWLHAARVSLPQLPLEPLQTLTNLYVRARFSPHDLSADATAQARAARARIVWPKRGEVKRSQAASQT